MKSQKLSNISLWSGISSIFLSFPLNIIAVITGYKAEERLTPQDSDKTALKGRVGRRLGIFSIFANVIALSAYLIYKEKK